MIGPAHHHEARHVVASLWLGHTIREVQVAEDGRNGHVRYVVPWSVEGDEFRRWLMRQVIVALVGYLGDPDRPPNWPPPYEEARTCELEGLSFLIANAELTEDEYVLLHAQAVIVAHDPDFQHAIAHVAMLLEMLPRLNGATLGQLLADRPDTHYPRKG